LTIKSTIESFLKGLLPIGLYKAIRLLGKEVTLYRYHRAGVKKARVYADRNGLRLNIGCGPNYKEGWVNIDLSSKADLSLDVRERIPLPDGSAMIIYSEHFFEHLDYPDDAKHFYEKVSDCWSPMDFSAWAFPTHVGHCSIMRASVTADGYGLTKPSGGTPNGVTLRWTISTITFGRTQSTATHTTLRQ